MHVQSFDAAVSGGVKGGMLMTLQQIKYILKTAECGSISEAAKQMYVAQSSISTAIKDVEKEYGLTVFTRSPKGVFLTREGEGLLLELRKIAELMDYVKAEYTQGAEECKRFCVTASFHMQGREPFVQLVQQLRGRRLRLGYLECSSRQIVQNVGSGQADVGLTFFTTTAARKVQQVLDSFDLQFHLLGRGVPYIYMGRNHPLADRKYLRRADMLSYPLVSYDISPNFSNIFTDVLAVQNPSFISASDKLTAISLLRQTECFLIGSGRDAKEMQREGIILVPISDAGSIECGWIAKRHAKLSEIAQEFVRLVEEEEI
jgi:DNA-binding transcriptional LysR family regulator